MGDFGGPVIVNDTLVGIMHKPRGRGIDICDLTINPTIVSDVQHYAEWIRGRSHESFATMLIVTWDMMLSLLAIAFYVEVLFEDFA